MALHKDEYLDPEDYPSTFIWREGNYSCNCNRELMFERARGNDPDDATCGEGGYRAEVMVDGKWVPVESI